MTSSFVAEFLSFLYLLVPALLLLAGWRLWSRLRPHSLEQRLAELDRLQARGVISAEEKQQARQRLLERG